MIVFATVLEIDGNPVLYNVYKNRSLAFLNPSQARQAPIIYAPAKEQGGALRGPKMLL